MPEAGPEEATPSGNGDGQYKPVQAPGTVLAIVGSAHVRGILREWEAVAREGYLQQLRGLLKPESEALQA